MDHRPADAQLGHSTHKPHYLGMNYYVIFLGRLGSNEFHLRLKKSKSWEPFWSYQLDNTANSAHLPQKWAELAMLFSW